MKPLRTRQRIGPDLLAVTLLLSAASIELLIREWYFQLSAELPELAVVVALGLGLAAVLWIASASANPSHHRRAGRVVLLAACVAYLYIVLAWPQTRLLPQAGASTSLLIEAGLFVLAGVAAARLSDATWARVRPALVAGAVMFVLSQPLIASLKAPRIAWPPPRLGAAPPSAQAPPTITIVILLDELNAKSAPPIERALARAGLNVRTLPVPSVGQATIQVVPAMFTRQDFSQAKPCGPAAICGSRDVLDFAKVTASRPDIDLVGFYHPYCAIQGLRYCTRLLTDSPIFDVDRWFCAAARRRWISASDERLASCARLRSQVQARLVASVEGAIWQAPLWERGGFMYAHVPLPHPPGLADGGSLKTHYEDNVARAAELVFAMARRARSVAGDKVNVIVISDHPLRPSLWCAMDAYAHNGCPAEESIVDARVPLIVSGAKPFDLDGVRSNQDVFWIQVPD